MVDVTVTTLVVLVVSLDAGTVLVIALPTKISMMMVSMIVSSIHFTACGCRRSLKLRDLDRLWSSSLLIGATALSVGRVEAIGKKPPGASIVDVEVTVTVVSVETVLEIADGVKDTVSVLNSVKVTEATLVSAAAAV